MSRPLLLALALVVVLLMASAPAASASAPPVCPGDRSYEINAGDTLPLLGSCTDDGPGALTYSVTTWPTRGSLVGTPAGDATYTPSIGLYGEDWFIYRATDGEGQFDEAKITINVLAPPPGTGGLDPACPEPTHAFVPFHGTITLTGNCRDPEGSPISYGLVSLPTQGTFIGVGPDYVVYQHQASTLDPDSFQYSANDGVNTVNRTVSLEITDPDVSLYSTGAEATATAPFVASVDTAGAASVVVGERATSTPPPSGYFFLSREFNIVAPPQTDADPLRLTFTIDHTQAALGDGIEVFRNGAPITKLCDDGDAIPDDPCIASRGFVDGSETADYQIVVLSSHASVWNLGTSANYPFAGFYRPVNNAPIVNTVKAGRSIPVKFGLGGDEGLGVLAAGSPSSRRVACPNGGTDELESTAAESEAGLHYDALTGVYTYVWKTSSAWAGTCRELTVALDDGTTHTALFGF